MTNPTISIICPSIRPEMWLMQYQSLLSNTTPFEIIYVGDKKPDFSLPTENMRFIYSEEKINRCSHIAIQQANGKYILQSCDDVVYSDFFLDILHEKAEAKNCSMFVPFSSCWFTTITPETGTVKSLVKCSRNDILFAQCLFGKKLPADRFNPYLPACSYLMLTSDYWKLGGFDDRLDYRWFGWDLTMRVCESGGELEFCPDIACNELRFGRRQKGSILEYSLVEQVLFISLWCKDNDQPDRFTPDNLPNIKTWQDLKLFSSKDITIMRTRSDACHPIEESHRNTT